MKKSNNPIMGISRFFLEAIIFQSWVSPVFLPCKVLRKIWDILKSHSWVMAVTDELTEKSQYIGLLLYGFNIISYLSSIQIRRNVKQSFLWFSLVKLSWWPLCGLLRKGGPSLETRIKTFPKPISFSIMLDYFVDWEP